MTVVCYEQRGCGRSDPPPSADDYSLPLLVSDLDELRAALEIDRVVLLGYSFGSELAMEYALAHTKRVTRMVLQAPRATTPGPGRGGAAARLCRRRVGDREESRAVDP